MKGQKNQQTEANVRYYRYGYEMRRKGGDEWKETQGRGQRKLQRRKL